MVSWKRWGGAAAAIGLAAAIHASAGAETAPADSPRSLDLPAGALVAPGKAADLELLFTGDVIGYIDPCG